MKNDLKQIDQQIAELVSQKKKLLEGKRRDALKQVKEAIATYGFSAADLGFRQRAAEGRAKRKVAAKYANPANPGETWTGRGKTPKWVAGLLASGKTKEDILIRK